MIKLAVSDLDNWLAYTRPAIEAFELTTDQLLARLRREEPATDEMQIGSAFHSVMERLFEGDLEYSEQDGWEFHFEIEHTIGIPESRELFIERIYETPSGPALLRGRVDARDGDLVTDYKLTMGQFDAERYADSMQWRAYLDITGAKRFQHLVFQGNRPGSRGQHIWIYDVHEFTQWPYPEMHEQVQQCVNELAAFVSVYVPDKISDLPAELPQQ